MRASFPRVAPAIAALLLGLSARVAGAVEPPATPAVGAPTTLTKPDPITLDIGMRAGFGVRAGSAPNFPITGRLGGVFGLGLGISPTPLFTVGLAWERSGLGSEKGTGDVADVDLTRALDVFWASVRIHVVNTQSFRFVVQIAPGLGVQHVSSNVLLYSVSTRPTAYACSESGGPGLALRAGVGTEVRLGGPLWFTADAQFDHVHMSDEMLGECVPGAGALSILGMRFGIVYRADVTRWLR